MAKNVITLSGIIAFFKDNLNSVTKGELKYKAGFVLELKIAEFVIKAQIRASMKDKSYKISLIIDGDGGICKGQSKCFGENGYAATWQLHQFMPISEDFPRLICPISE